MTDAAWSRHPHEIRLAIAEEIKVLMLRRHVTQEMLGDAIGMRQPQLSKRLNGSIVWDTDVLFKIARYFDVPVTDLLPTSPWTSFEGAGQGEYEQMSIPFRHLVAI